MNLKHFLSTLLLIAGISTAWAQGINFETGNWASVKAKAAKENKLIYLDIYTSWCGPCKMMAKNYFPAKAAGDVYNKLFVCYKLDAEKNEGVAIAEQYKVNAYPTNIFIDAKTGKVIYRTVGMPATLQGFIDNAQVAIEERKDPMTLAQYQAKFKSGKYDQSFLKKYLAKNKRLERNNDTVIDAYLKSMGTAEVTDSLLLFVAKYQTGVSNDGFKLLKNNSDRYNKINGDEESWLDYSQSLYRNEVEAATESKNEKRFRDLLARSPEFEKNDVSTMVYFLETAYYRRHKMYHELDMTRKAYARGIMSLSNEEIASHSRMQLKRHERRARWMIEQEGIADKQAQDNAVKQAMEQPEVKYNRELFFANELNETSWAIYEKNKEAKQIDTKEVAMALEWAKRGAELANVHTESYLPIADTYAHLLYLSGKKEEAKKVQTELIQRGKKEGFEDLDQYENFLNEL